MKEFKMKQSVQLLTIITLISIITYVWTENNNVPTVKYFPIHDVNTFTKSETTLQVKKRTDEIEWTVFSKSNVPTYLRQDISILYVNGMFQGVFSAWRQQISELKQQTSFPLIKNGLYESISYHHGEIHEANTISSMQAMSKTQLFTSEENDKAIYFSKPKTAIEQEIASSLRHETDKVLQKHWTKLVRALDIDITTYDCIPLTQWTQIGENSTFTRLSTSTQQRVIGQFWEGLYKNYILLLQEQQDVPHYIPLILLDKNVRELRIIYELNGEPEQLIQRISTHD